MRNAQLLHTPCGALGFRGVTGYNHHMKICLISNLYPPYVRGGAEYVVQQLARGLVARGHRVHVVTTAPFSRVFFGTQVVIEDGVVVHRTFHWNLFFTLSSGRRPVWLRLLAHAWTLKNVLLAWRVSEILQHGRFDVVHTHNLAGTSFFIPVMIRGFKIPHVHTVHDIQLAIPSGRLLVGEEFARINCGWPVRMFQWAQRKLWKSPAVVTSPSAWLLQYYRVHKFFARSRQEVVRHFFSPALAAEVHVPREKFTIVFVGQIERAKGAVMIAQLFAELHGQGFAENAELVMVGAGTDSLVAHTLTATCPSVQFVGAIAHERVQTFLRVADVLVVPSLLYENSPNVVIEALSVNCPVSVSDVGGAAELVQENDGGWVVEPTEAAWRAHLLWLLQNREIVVQKRPQLKTTDPIAHFEQLYQLCKPHKS